MSVPLVSVVMAAYNAETYLKEAIESILRQTYQNFEFLIINDGSTDNSKEIILSFKDPRIIYLENKINAGIVQSRNTLLEACKGKYMAVLDSDDIALPNRLALQVAFMEANPEYGMCGTYFKVINNRGKKMYPVKFPVSDKDLKTYLNFGNCFCHSTMLIRRELVAKFKYSKDFQLGEDYALWLAISAVSKVYTLPQFTTYYRIHGQNVSVSRHAQMFEEIKKINTENLHKLQVPFTEDELEAYGHFIIFDHPYFTDKSHFKTLEEWIFKLYDTIQMNPDIEHQVVLKFLLQRWFVICFKIRHFSDMLINRLFLRDMVSYTQYLSQFLLAYYKKSFHSS